MTKKQWIWLIVAVAVFVAAGVVSVVTNTWSHRTAAESLSASLETFSGAAESAAFPSEPYLARLDIEGTIMSDSEMSALSGGTFNLDYILDYIDRLMNDESNAGILLYINSGGGEVKAADDVYLKLMDYKAATGRPIYAYFDGIACSGAYYIAMAADNIWANRNTDCVNIGVYMSTYNLKGLFDKYGVKEIMVRSTGNKAMGSLGQEWTEEHQAIYQEMIDEIYDQFVGIVAEGRGMTKEQVKALNDGRVMLASQALEAGFIDGICRYEEYENYLLENTGYSLYEEEPAQLDAFMQLLQNIYGRLEAVTPRSELEILREFMDRDGEPVVMAYAG